MLTRRRFLQLAPAGMILANSWATTPAQAFSIPVSGVERLTRMLVETPRADLLPLLVTKINQGIFPRSLLASLTMAAVHHVEPYPEVGFKYHAVMMLSSVHNTLRHLDESEQWLGMLWAADTFKQAQQNDTFNGDWQLLPANFSAKVDPVLAFRNAMDNWDGEAADAAISLLVEEVDIEEIFPWLFYYAARDFRDIGHKTIAVSNSYRLLRLFGDAYAQPVLRSTVYALLNHEGESNPSNSDHDADKPWKQNFQFASRFPDDWQDGGRDDAVIPDILAALRTAKSGETGALAVDLLQRNVSPQTLWDATMLSAGELLMRISGITSLHANTSVNAMYFGYKRIDDDHKRRMLLLQAMSFVTLFRDLLGENQRQIQIDTYEPRDSIAYTGDDQEMYGQLFESISSNRSQASGQLLYLLQQGADVADYKYLGRMYTLMNNAGYHDYKFTEAAFENSYALSPEWQQRYLGASIFYMNGSEDKANSFVNQARDLLFS